jgi:hypothetical protein
MPILHNVRYRTHWFRPILVPVQQVLQYVINYMNNILEHNTEMYD